MLDPAATGASGHVLPRLWNSGTDRAYRATYQTLPDDGVVLLHGALLMGRGLPVEVGVRLWMSPAALARSLPADHRWMLPAYARHEAEHDPSAHADLVVLADHPDRPAVQRAGGS